MEYQFLLSYNLLDPNYGQLYNNQNRISLVEKPPLLQKMIAAHFNKQTQSNIQQLKNIKYISCVQTLAEFEDDNELILIYPNVLPYTLTQQKIEQISNEQKLQIAIQLILAFLEFDRREIQWFVNDLNQLYFYDNLLFIGFFDIDFQNYKEQKFSKSQQEQQCKNLIFLYFFNDFLVDCQNDPINIILNKLVAKLQNNTQQNEIDFFYRELMNVLRIDDPQGGGNSYVSYYQLNLKNKILQPNWPSSIAIKELKTYKLSIMNKLEKENYLKNIKREIEILELFNFSQNVSQILAYFRFNESIFFISKKYWGTLFDLVKNEWKNIFLPKKEIFYCLQVANAYLQLKLKNVIHRDLKPNNFFVEKLEDNSFNICVADFDRSRVIDNDNVDQEVSKHNLSNTPKYDPPETYFNDRYDIWQIGIVLLFIASQGNFEWIESRSCITDQEFNENFGQDKIKDTLKQFQYQQEFIDIIIGCLQKDPKNRFYAEEIVEKLQQLLPQKKKDGKMKILSE